MDLVFLHGPAASGKLTTAREIERRIRYPVFHNHLVVDLLSTVFTFGTLPFVELRERFWLDVIERAAREGQSLIFTLTPETTVLAGFSTRVGKVVERHGGSLHRVKLTVSSAEQERRLADPSRLEFHKVRDMAVLRRLQLQQVGHGAEQPPADLTIDTDASTATQSAEMIITSFNLVADVERHRYPEI